MENLSNEEFVVELKERLKYLEKSDALLLTEQQREHVSLVLEAISHRFATSPTTFTDILCDYLRYSLDLFSKFDVTLYVSQFVDLTGYLERLIDASGVRSVEPFILELVKYFEKRERQLPLKFRLVLVFCLISIVAANGFDAIQDEILDLIAKHEDSLRRESGAEPIHEKLIVALNCEYAEWIRNRLAQNVNKYHDLRKLIGYDALTSDKVCPVFATSIAIGKYTLEPAKNADLCVDFNLTQKSIAFGFSPWTPSGVQHDSDPTQTTIRRRMVQHATAVKDEKRFIEMVLTLNLGISTSNKETELLFADEREVKIRFPSNEMSEQLRKDLFEWWDSLDFKSGFSEAAQSNQQTNCDDLRNLTEM